MIKRLLVSLDEKNGNFFFSSSVPIETINPAEKVQFVAVLSSKLGVNPEDLMSVIGMLDYVNEQERINKDQEELEKNRKELQKVEKEQERTIERRCVNCKYHMFSDCYLECEKGYLTGPLDAMSCCENFTIPDEKKSDSENNEPDWKENDGL